MVLKGYIYQTKSQSDNYNIAKNSVPFSERKILSTKVDMYITGRGNQTILVISTVIPFGVDEQCGIIINFFFPPMVKWQLLQGYVKQLLETEIAVDT